MWKQFCQLNIVDAFNQVMKYYAVSVGRTPGIYKSWAECEKQVKSFSNAKYKKFTALQDAQQFINAGKPTENINSNNSVSTPCNISTSSSVGTKRKLCDKTTLNNKLDAKRFKSKTKEDCPVVYTDGACSSNGKKGSTAGYGVWWGDNHPMNLSCKLHGIQTNQRAEIAAISAAIKQAKEMEYRKILIKTDSMFVINCVTKWASNWRQNNWKKSDGKPVVHKKEFLEILEGMKEVQVEFEHVFGHKGIYGNEKADQLAVAGAKK